MTRAYLRYALMAAPLGFWLLFASIGLGWGGMLGIFYFLRLVPTWAILPCLLGILVGGACIPLIAVTALTRRMAAEAPLSCSVFAGLFPLLSPLPVLAVILSNRDYLVFLEELLPLLAAGLLYVLFLLAFHRHSRARKTAAKHGEQPPTSTNGKSTAAQGYPRYLGTVVAASVFFLPLCTLLNMFVVNGVLFTLTDSYLFFFNNGAPFHLNRALVSRLGSGLIVAPYLCNAAIACCSLTVPAACGGWLASRAQAASTFSARYLPLLLPPLIFLSILLLHVRASFGSVSVYLLAMLAFLLTYGLFLCAFRLWSRSCAPTRGRRVGVVCLLLALVPFCAGLAVSLSAAHDTLITGDHDAVGTGDNWDFRKRFSPDTPGNALALPAAPPSLRLGENLPTLSGVKSSRPLYAAAFQAVACLGEDGRLLSEEILSRRVKQARLSSKMDTPDSVDIFFGPPPSKYQLDELRAQGLTPDVRPVAHEALVFFVHKDNPVRNLSSEQLRRIYTGEITNWKEVGGRDERILPFQHEKWGENQRLLKRLVLRGEEAAPPLRERGSMGPSRDVARYRKRAGALGFGLRWYLGQWFPDGDVRPLAVDGVPPTDETLRDGSYPLRLPLCMIACRPLSAEGRAFRDWLLGPEGRDLIRRAGYLPWDEENDGTAENGGDTAAHESRGSRGDNEDAEEER